MIGMEGRGIYRAVGLPRYGRQDLGLSPGGAQDRFALEVGNLLLDNPQDSPAVEMVVPPLLRFLRDCCFVLTGAARRESYVESSAARTPVRHGEVSFAPKGAALVLGPRAYGFRSYLCYRASPRQPSSIVGRTRGPFAAVAGWQDPEGLIRCTRGPEYPLLGEPEAFLGTCWRVTSQLDDMGVRLESAHAPSVAAAPGMASAPVNDGTVQLTPSGPIVLLRERQTVGGYPRVLNVIGADVDLVAQFAPRESLRFRLVEMREVRKVNRRRSQDIARLAARLARRSRIVGAKKARR